MKGPMPRDKNVFNSYRKQILLTKLKYKVIWRFYKNLSSWLLQKMLTGFKLYRILINQSRLFILFWEVSFLYGLQ